MAIPSHALSFAALSFLCFSGTVIAQQPHGGRLDSFADFTVTTLEGGTLPNVVSAGDLNGDGHDDILIGRVVETFSAFTGCGTVELVSGIDSSSLVKWGGNFEYSEFGAAIAVIDDCDGDGVPDIAIGAPNEAFGVGAVYLVSGAPPYGPIQYWGGTSSERFGASVADAGDINGDGVPDLLIGSPGYDHGVLGLTDSGKAFLYSGADFQVNGLIYEWEGLDEGGGLGTSFLVVDDLSGDGVQDFAISQPGADPMGVSIPNVAVYSGSTGFAFRFLFAPDGNDGFGAAMASPGDFDGDGWDDILVGAHKMDPIAGDHEIGSVILYSGLTETPLLFWSGEEKFSWFGYSLDTADINGDGTQDILIGSPLFTGDGPTNRGAFYVYDGTNGEILLRQTGTQESQILGAFCQFGGDVNNDGTVDILAPYLVNPTSTQPTGKVAVYSSEVIPQMTANSTTLSISAGGTITFDLDFTSEASFYSYKLLFSSAGMGPINILGLPVPLSYDINLVNSYLGIYAPVFGSPTGLLNPSGKATAQLNVPAGSVSPALLGSTFYFASICNVAWGTPERSSVAVPITFVP